MRRLVAGIAAGLLACGLGGPASAKDAPEVAKAHIRYAHSYAAAMAEAKERGCVIFATVHEDG